MSDQTVKDQVKDYYGKVLQKSDDLKTNACTTAGRPPPHMLTALRNIHPEVVEKYYGCGLIVPDEMDGLKVLDLGSGSGRDVYVIAQLVGEKGAVCGLDMTEEQLSVANKHKGYHADKFGYANVEFRHGYIEDLASAGLADESFDVIVSNCVINLSPNKEAVLKEAYRVLKPGGEMFFSDVYSDRRVPEELVKHPVLFGECLSGALYWNDFITLSRKAGFQDPRLVSDSPISVSNQDILNLLGNIKFYSATYRLFKLPSLEQDCEDYGQAVIYKGTVQNHPHAFTLDAHHVIQTGQVFPVCRNTYNMLYETRFKPHFEFLGEGKVHYGIFQGCGKLTPFASSSGGASDGGAASSTGGCC